MQQFTGGRNRNSSHGVNKEAAVAVLKGNSSRKLSGMAPVGMAQMENAEL